MIKGLELAGKNPTRQAFISNLRKVGNYTAGGLLAKPDHLPTFRNTWHVAKSGLRDIRPRSKATRLSRSTEGSRCAVTRIPIT